MCRAGPFAFNPASANEEEELDNEDAMPPPARCRPTFVGGRGRFDTMEISEGILLFDKTAAAIVDAISPVGAPPADADVAIPAAVGVVA